MPAKRNETPLQRAKRHGAMFALKKGVPAFVADRRMPAAAVIWAQLMDALPAEMTAVRTTERVMLGMLAYYCAEWIAAVDDLLAHGHYERTQTGAGGAKIVVNPSVARRDGALRAINDISAKFGLTPLDLERLKASVATAADKGKARSPAAQNRSAAADDDAPAAEVPTQDAWSQLLGPAPATSRRKQ